MNLLFINYHDFSSNSAIHIFHIANNLVELGHECYVCVPMNADSVRLVGKNKFRVITYKDVLSKDIPYINNLPVDLIHVWTPRECNRKITEQLLERYNCSYIVHLEDNEEAIFIDNTGICQSNILQLKEDELDAITPEHLSHPVKYREFIKKAQGITVLMESLLEFSNGCKEQLVFWPGCEKDFFETIINKEGKRKELGISENEYVVVYTGNVHGSNFKEVYSLYLAIALLNKMGTKIKLVRTGKNYVNLMDDVLTQFKECYIELGFVDREYLIDIVKSADFLVQPGTSNPFNDYRFPSKLPEFLATGIPVILPDANIGKYLSDCENCVLLKKGDAQDIAKKIMFLISDAKRAIKIGKNGKIFAEANFNWYNNAVALEKMYRKILEKEVLDEFIYSKDRHITLFESRVPKEILNYWSTDFFLCDLKKYQDCLMTFIINSIGIDDKVKILEIGGGNSRVLNYFSKQYKCWNLEPYEGIGNGPTEEYDANGIVTVRDYIGNHSATLEENSFDLVFSISVMEHIDLDDNGMESIIQDIDRILKAGGRSIHLIDCLYKDGDVEFPAMAKKLISKYPYLQIRIKDSELYCMNKESYNKLWKKLCGGTSYEEFGKPFNIMLSWEKV